MLNLSTCCYLPSLPKREKRKVKPIIQGLRNSGSGFDVNKHIEDLLIQHQDGDWSINVLDDTCEINVPNYYPIYIRRKYKIIGLVNS